MMKLKVAHNDPGCARLAATGRVSLSVDRHVASSPAPPSHLNMPLRLEGMLFLGKPSYERLYSLMLLELITDLGGCQSDREGPFSSLKVPPSSFTFKIFLKHYTT